MRQCGNGVLEFQKSLVQTRYQQTDCYRLFHYPIVLEKLNIQIKMTNILRVFTYYKYNLQIFTIMPDKLYDYMHAK
jgi:hypothetical protein